MKTRIVFALYLLACVLQIFSCIPPKKKPLRACSKLLLMPLLALWLTFRTLPNVPVLIVFGLIAGFIGDSLLLFPGRKTVLFIIGASFFALGHALYTAWFLKNTLPLTGTLAVIAIAVVCYGIALVFWIRRFKGCTGKAALCRIAAYFTVLSLMSLSALAFAVKNGGWAWLCWASSALFLISDGILTYDSYKKELRLGTLFVMITYILAQTGIATGAMLFMKG